MISNQSGMFSNNNDFQFNNSIKVFISLYKFQQQLINNKDKNFSSKVILLDKKWFENYKDFYFCDKVFNLITEYNLTDFDFTEQKIIFNSLVNKFTKKIESLKPKDLLLFYDQEFPNIMTSTNDDKIKFVKDFEIINEEIYENLLNTIGTFKYCECNAIICDGKICQNKIIIKYINENQKCFNLLIGNIGKIGEREKNTIYIPEILVNFPNSGSLNDEFNDFIDIKVTQYINGSFGINNQDIRVINHNFFQENPYDDKIKLYNNLLDKYPDLTTKIFSRPVKELINNKIKREKVIRALISYYLNNEIIKTNINIESFCFLINKTWIKKFKKFFDYNNFSKVLKNILENNAYKSDIKQILKDEDILEKLLKEILSIPAFSDKNFIAKEKSMLTELSSFNLFLIDFNYYNKALKEEKDYMKIYDNFEIILFEKHNFINELFPRVAKRFKKYQYCINQDSYLSIFTELKSENVMNIFSISEKNNEININHEFFVKTKNIEPIKDYFKNNSIKNDILSLKYDEKFIAKLNDTDANVYILNNSEIIRGFKKKDNIREILFKYIELIESIKTKNYKNINNNFIYLIPKEYFIEYFEKYNLKISEINNILSNNLNPYFVKQAEKIKENITKSKNKKEKNNNITDIELKKELLKIYFNDKFKFPKNITFENNTKTNYFEKAKKVDVNDLPHIITRNNNEKIFYYNNLYLLTEEIVKLINIDSKIFQKIQFLIKEKNIFLFPKFEGQNIIEIGNLNENNCFEIEYLIDANKDHSLIINNIQELNYHDFFTSSFAFKNVSEKGNDKESKNEFSNVSPFFDRQNNIIGYGYKISKDIDNFSNSYYSPILINNIYLIIFFKFPKYAEKYENNEKYYLISETWMNYYKEQSMYEGIKKEIENSKIKSLQTIFKDEHLNQKLLNKKICYLIPEISELNRKLRFDLFLNNVPFDPDFGWRKDMLSGNLFYFYRDYYILSEDIFKRLFNLNSQQANEIKEKNNYCQCFYEEGYMLVILKNALTRINKIVVEVGNLDEQKKFNLIYLIVCDSLRDYQNNLNKIREIKNFFETLSFDEQNIVTLTDDNTHKIVGYIFKYSEDKNVNNDINNSIDYEIPPEQNPQPPQPPIPNNPQSLTQIFKNPPMLGLQNVGATCYMNATIQCFGQIEKFSLYFKFDPHIKEVIKKYRGNDCLTESFKDLIENLWPTDKDYLKAKYRGKNSNNEYYIPKKFKEKISKMNPLFQGAQANDAKDLVNFLVMQLHEELNIGMKSNNNGEVPQTNENLIFNNFCQTYYYENKSIICDLFYGINGTKYECSNCHTQKYNFQIGFFYIFPLEEVKKYKILRLQQQFDLYLKMQLANNMIDYNNMLYMQQCANIQNQNINSVSIMDCFDYNQKIEYMVGDNAMYCNTCNRSENATYQNYIANCPEVIIIILNRGQGIQFKVKCEFTEFLDIKNYVKYHNNTSCQYKLIGVVTHMGESGSSGHFVAFCKSPIDNQWYNYNDDLCFLVNNFKEQVIDYAMPYILFYQKI